MLQRPALFLKLTFALTNTGAGTMVDGQMMKGGEWFCIYICMYGLHTGPCAIIPMFCRKEYSFPIFLFCRSNLLSWLSVVCAYVIWNLDTSKILMVFFLNI